MGRMMLLRKVNVDVVVEGDGMIEVVENQRDSYYLTLLTFESSMVSL